MDSDDEEEKSSSLLDHFSSIADHLSQTAKSEHTMKSNLDHMLNLIKGFQSSVKERTQLLHAWRVKTFLAQHKSMKLESVIGIEKDFL
jgi:hypothetical protein